MLEQGSTCPVRYVAFSFSILIYFFYEMPHYSVASSRRNAAQQMDKWGQGFTRVKSYQITRPNRIYKKYS